MASMNSMTGWNDAPGGVTSRQVSPASFVIMSLGACVPLAASGVQTYAQPFNSSILPMSATWLPGDASTGTGGLIDSTELADALVDTGGVTADCRLDRPKPTAAMINTASRTVASPGAERRDRGRSAVDSSIR
jgi:hypothetical protein